MIDTMGQTAGNLSLEPAIIVLIALLLGLGLEFFVFPRLQKLAAGTSWIADDVILGSLRWMGLLWSLLAGMALATIRIEAIPSLLLLFLQRGLLSITFLSLVIVAVRMAMRFVTVVYTGKYASQNDHASVSILKNSITVLIYLLGLLIGLQALGVPITPILATLGIGGLAVSLALQDTLSNLFSGIWLVASKQIRAGDYVRLSNGEEGYVVDINWRTTNIRQLNNNMIVMPNTIMTSAMMINSNVPAREMSVLIDVGVSYESDLELVERVTIEVGREVMQEVAGGVPHSEPFIRYNRLQDFSINFTTILRAQEYVSQYVIQHEFIKRLIRRYRQEGIVIPYPIRTLQTPGANHLEIVRLAESNGRLPAEAAD
jgi:small-conductance mechanosensitive channel